MAAARPFVWVREDSGRGFAKVATAGLDDVYDLAAAAGGALALGAARALPGGLLGCAAWPSAVARCSGRRALLGAPP